MGLEIERDYRLRLMDFDRYGRLQPASVLDVFQDMATIHAIEMGIGHDEMLAKGLFWVVARVKFEVVRAPRRYECVRARTWPHDPTRFSFMRDYALDSLDGEPLVKGTSEWVVVDASTRKFASLLDVYEGPHDFVEQRAFDRRPKKIADFEAAAEGASTVIAAWTDIDVNGHVNNARYANFVMDAVRLPEQLAIATFQIDYRQEVMAGCPLELHVCDEGGLIRVKGTRQDGKTAFASQIETARL